jgi:hypothetical protein
MTKSQRSMKNVQSFKSRHLKIRWQKVRLHPPAAMHITIQPETWRYGGQNSQAKCNTAGNTLAGQHSMSAKAVTADATHLSALI